MQFWPVLFSYVWWMVIFICFHFFQKLYQFTDLHLFQWRTFHVPSAWAVCQGGPSPCRGDRDSEPQNTKLASLTWLLSRLLSMHSGRSWWLCSIAKLLTSSSCQASRSEDFVELVAAVRSTAQAARKVEIGKNNWTRFDISRKITQPYIHISSCSCSSFVLFLTVEETDQVEAELQVEASSLREELGERKYQVGKWTHDKDIRREINLNQIYI